MILLYFHENFIFLFFSLSEQKFGAVFFFNFELNLMKYPGQHHKILGFHDLYVWNIQLFFFVNLFYSSSKNLSYLLHVAYSLQMLEWPRFIILSQNRCIELYEFNFLFLLVNLMKKELSWLFQVNGMTNRSKRYGSIRN